MRIERATCQALLAKTMVEHKSIVDYVDTMTNVMENRGHDEVLAMVTYFVEEIVDWDEDEIDGQARLNMRYGMIATAMMGYSVTLAAKEVRELNKLYVAEQPPQPRRRETE